MAERLRLADLVARGSLLLNDGYRTRADELGRPGIPVLRVAEVQQGHLTPTFGDHVHERYRIKIAEKVSRPGDVVVTTKGTVGRVARITPDAAEFVYSPQVCFFRCLDDTVDSRWLYYWFRGPEFVNQAAAVQSQTDMAAYINLADMRTMRLTVPSITHQRGIAETLGAVDDKIESNRRLQRKAVELSASLVFVQTREATAVGFEKAMSVVMGSAFKGDEFSVPGTGRPLLRIRDLKTFSSQTWTTESRPDEIVIQPGDIVVGMDAEFRATLWQGMPSLLNQRVCAFRPRSGVSRAFVLAAIAPQLAFYEKAKSGTTVIHLNKGDIERFIVPDLTREQHAELVRQTEPLLDLVVNAAAQSSRLADLRDALLPELLSGRIRMPEASKAVDDVLENRSDSARTARMTTQPPADDPAEVAEFWRLTQEALAKHPEALDEDRELWDKTLMDGLEDD